MVASAKLWRPHHTHAVLDRMASDHNILARTDKSDAKGLATSAAGASPMAAASANPFDQQLTFGIDEGRTVVNDPCGNDGG
jgi:hypothetical protein